MTIHDDDTGYQQRDPRVTPGAEFKNRQGDRDDVMSDVFEGAGQLDSEHQNWPSEPRPFQRPPRSINRKELSEREGPYVVTFGRPQCGKTTMHQLIIHWMDSVQDFATARPLPIGEDMSGFQFQMAALQALDENRLLPPTSAGTALELHHYFRPDYARAPELNVIFLESAGESFSDVRTTANWEPQVFEEMDALLNNDNVVPAFLLVCDGSDPAFRQVRTNDAVSDDNLFHSLLNVMHIRYEGRLDTAPILLIIAKWDLVREQYQYSSKLNVNEFVREHLPRTFNALTKHPGSVGVTTFTAGDIREEADEDDNVRDVIKMPDTKSPEKVVCWLYQQFTGMPCGKDSSFKKFLDKMIRWLS